MLSRQALKHEAIDGGITIGAASAMGAIHGRAGEMKKIGPVPLDAGIGLLSTAIGVSGVLGASGSHHAFSVAKGTLSYFFGSIFAQVGQKMRKRAKELQGGAVAPDGALSGGATSRTVVKGPGRGAPAMPPAQTPANQSQFDARELVRRVTGRRAA
jgi:hypothetical protein